MTAQSGNERHLYLSLYQLRVGASVTCDRNSSPTARASAAVIRDFSSAQYRRFTAAITLQETTPVSGCTCALVLDITVYHERSRTAGTALAGGAAR